MDTRRRARLAGVAALILALIASSSGCAFRRASSPRHAPGAPPLRVGTSGDYAPFSSRAADGTLGGFDVEVARAYAADRGRDIVLVPFRWPDLAARFAAGDFDVVMSGVTVRADRLVTAIMTATVARADAVLAIADAADRPPAPVERRRHATAADDVARFDTPQTRIAVNRGGHLEQLARARFRRAQIVAVDDNTTLPALLARGDADSIVTDSLELAAFATRCTERCPRAVARLASDRKAYWLPPANGALAADLDGWLLDRERSGWLPALRARLLGNAAAVAGGAAAPDVVSVSAASGMAPLDPATASLVEDVRRRLTLMPLVAAAKHAVGRPIEDRAREAAVEREAAARAAMVAIDVPSFVAFVKAEIAAAKAVQRATAETTPAAFTLDDLRRAIDRADTRIVLALAAVAPIAASAKTVAAELVSDDVPGLGPDVRRAVARALRGVRKQPDVFSTGRAPCSGSMVRPIFDSRVVWGGGECGGSG